MELAVGKEQNEAAAHAEHRIRQLLALNQAAVAITGELELDKALQRIVDVARRLVNCKYAALGVLGEDGFIERFPTSGISESDLEKLGAPPRGHGLLGVMLRAGRSLRIPDMSKDPRRVGFPPHHPMMTSLLGVPIFVQGKLVGDLYLTDKIDGPEFSEEDEWLVQLLATHAATALTNAKLHSQNLEAIHRIQKERARSQALFRVTEAINGSVRLDEVIPLILESTVQILDAQGAAVYILEKSVEASEEVPDGQRFVARYAIGLEQSLTTEMAEMPLNNSVAGRAVTSGRTQVMPDTRDEPNLHFPRLADKPLRSLAVVPLIASGQILGALSTYSDEPNAFNEEAVQMLEAFGAAASTALHNATLYEEARQGRESAEREQVRLREVEQMKDEFLSTAAHELRTPLTAIRMSAGIAHEQLRKLLQEGYHQEGLDPRVVELIGLVVESSERMQSLVNDLLDLTRLEQGKATLAMEDLDLRDVVKTAVASVMPLLESKGQKLVMHMPELYCGIRGDRQRLEQLVINLLSNAALRR